MGRRQSSVPYTRPKRSKENKAAIIPRNWEICGGRECSYHRCTFEVFSQSNLPVVEVVCEKDQRIFVQLAVTPGTDEAVTPVVINPLLSGLLGVQATQITHSGPFMTPHYVNMRPERLGVVLWRQRQRTRMPRIV